MHAAVRRGVGKPRHVMITLTAGQRASVFFRRCNPQKSTATTHTSALDDESCLEPTAGDA